MPIDSKHFRGSITRRDGFSLIELMMVVGIIGILAAIAIPSFISYIRRSRTAEAYTFLGEIRQRQESYRAEFGQYCSVSAAPGSAIASGTWAPSTLPTDGDKVVWNPTTPNWPQLGAAPDGPVMFQYRSTAGGPGQTPGVPGYNGTDFWFVAQARGDLDDDGDVVIFEAYSASNHVFVGDSTMQPLGSGWE